MTQENNYTELSALGEFGLIDHLTANIKPLHLSTIKGIGDDAAVLSYPDSQILVTTDMLTEGIHFDLVYTPLKHLGYKSIVVNLSDIYAMNGTPRQVFVSIALSKRFKVEHVDELYKGIKLACERYGVDLAGGDTTSSLTGLTISVTAIGEAKAEKISLRSGAKVNDLIVVSGDLGAAYVGLQLLEREKNVFSNNPNVQPEFANRDYILERQLKPEARRDVVKFLDENNFQPTAMQDVSDGLSSELLHICRQSGVGCRVYEDKIPIDAQTIDMAAEFKLDPTVCALNGGEDYELLFTLPIADLERLQALAPEAGLSIVGYTTEASEGCNLIARDGSSVPLNAQGWNALKETD